jgi:hypothetical protein
MNNSEGYQIQINQTGISNTFLRDNFFRNSPNYQQLQWMDLQNEHFINWMDMETFHTFRKLWGHIDYQLIPDNYTIIVNNSNQIF